MRVLSGLDLCFQLISKVIGYITTVRLNSGRQMKGPSFSWLEVKSGLQRLDFQTKETGHGIY